MKKHNASHRAAALVNQAVDLLQRTNILAPASPVNTYLPANVRREWRRSAARLRAGNVQPRRPDLHSAEDLADIYERTVRRDEILEQSVADFQRITLELDRVLEENDPAVGATLDALVREAKRAAQKHGPGSDAADRYRQMLFLGWFGQQWHSRHRRQKGRPAPQSVAPEFSIEPRRAVSAAEPIVAIPPDGSGSGRERICLRIGTGESSWIGSFERGHQSVNTISIMPDGKHLFVSAGGAGYVIEASSRTLVETIGTEVAGVMLDETMTLFVVDHDGRSLEAFGRTGRLWKAEGISSGGFRHLVLTDRTLVGEARHWWRTEWVRFSVDLVTGNVRFAR